MPGRSAAAAASRRGAREAPERFEVCEVLHTASGRTRVRVLATATTAGGARLAARTIAQECGLEAAQLRIYDTLSGRWLKA